MDQNAGSSKKQPDGDLADQMMKVFLHKCRVTEAMKNNQMWEEEREANRIAIDVLEKKLAAAAENETNLLNKLKEQTEVNEKLKQTFQEESAKAFKSEKLYKKIAELTSLTESPPFCTKLTEALVKAQSQQISDLKSTIKALEASATEFAIELDLKNDLVIELSKTVDGYIKDLKTQVEEFEEAELVTSEELDTANEALRKCEGALRAAEKKVEALEKELKEQKEERADEQAGNEKKLKMELQEIILSLESLKTDLKNKEPKQEHHKKKPVPEKSVAPLEPSVVHVMPEDPKSLGGLSVASYFDMIKAKMPSEASADVGAASPEPFSPTSCARIRPYLEGTAGTKFDVEPDSDVAGVDASTDELWNPPFGLMSAEGSASPSESPVTDVADPKSSGGLSVASYLNMIEAKMPSEASAPVISASPEPFSPISCARIRPYLEGTAGTKFDVEPESDVTGVDASEELWNPTFGLMSAEGSAASSNDPVADVAGAKASVSNTSEFTCPPPQILFPYIALNPLMQPIWAHEPTSTASNIPKTEPPRWLDGSGKCKELPPFDMPTNSYRWWDEPATSSTPKTPEVSPEVSDHEDKEDEEKESSGSEVSSSWSSLNDTTSTDSKTSEDSETSEGSESSYDEVDDEEAEEA